MKITPQRSNGNCMQRSQVSMSLSTGLGAFTDALGLSKRGLAWLFEMDRRRGESFLCLPSPTLLPFPSPSTPAFWFWPWSSRTISLSLRLPLRLPPAPRFSVGSRLCLSTGHSWFPFTQAQSTLYLLTKAEMSRKRG